MTEPRVLKRGIIISIYFVLAILLGLGVYDLAMPDPSCTDGKQNQNEKGVDCGGRCAPCEDTQNAKPLEVLETAFVPAADEAFDFVAKLRNPNTQLGSGSFSFSFVLKGEDGKEIMRSEGSSFILPAETKYVVALGIRLPQGVSKDPLVLEITDISWQELKDVSRPQLTIVSKQYSKSPSFVGSEAYGVLRNESPYDLAKIGIVVVLRSQEGRILGISATEKTTVKAREERDFRLTWPYALSAEVSSVEMEASSNMYDPYAFAKPLVRN
ncbi:MAG TPA: hypothetical protein PKA31_03880 [Candidatus Moranbacteria bacterium]|nr:hypothetical protein [Candidatus Moranbacteria bacterium]